VTAPGEHVPRHAGFTLAGGSSSLLPMGDLVVTTAFDVKPPRWWSGATALRDVRRSSLSLTSVPSIVPAGMGRAAGSRCP
jgi:hypothetical protein